MKDEDTPEQLNDVGGDSEEALFLEAMQDVVPVEKGAQTVCSTRQELTPGQLQRRDDAQGRNKDRLDRNFLTLAEVPPIEPLAHVEWKLDGVQNAVFDKLRKAGYGIEAELDLHRKTVKEARILLFDFLELAISRQQRCVLLSPGKGEFSETPGRLKSFVVAWLQQHPQVIAYCSAQRHNGGVGALYVLLKKSPVSKELNREQHGQKSG